MPNKSSISKGLSSKNNVNDLIIISDTINVIEKENYKSYTINIKRSEKAFDVENLIVEENNGVKNAYILSYNFDENWIVNTINGIVSKPIGTVYYSPLGNSNIKGKSTASKTSGNCQWISVSIVTPCGCGHTRMSDCRGSTCGGNLYPSVYNTTVYLCGSSGGGGSEGIPLASSNNGPSPSGGGGGPSAGSSGSSSSTSINIPFKPSFINRKLNLSIEQYIWAIENPYQSDKIYDYLLSNNNTESREFAQNAIESLINGGEVDFEDNIIYDNSLNNSLCQKLVIEEATGTCSPLTQLILDIFEANDGTNLIFKSSSTLSNVNANTSSTSSYNATTHTCDITITFRESYLQTATDLAIARTAIHESLHATLVYMFEENLLQSANGTPMNGFEDFVEAYINHLSGLPVNLNKAHHELMADFIEDIASSLSVYGASNGHSNSFNFYKKLSWSGDILKTPTYQSLYPEYLNPLDATTNPSNVNPAHLDIVNTNAAEENDATYNFAHPNGTTYTHSPKGTALNATEPCN